MATISAPTDEIIKEKFEEYVAAVGRVAHAWNYLQESLGQLFTLVIPLADHTVLLAVWYSEPNDRAQRRMLRAAVNAGALVHWPGLAPLPESASDDVRWLLDKADKLGVRRDQAVHTPCSLFTGADGTEMAAAFYYGNPLAKQLSGKKLIEEFSISEWRAEQLTRYSRRLQLSLNRGVAAHPWPDERPSLERALLRQSPRRGPGMSG